MPQIGTIQSTVKSDLEAMDGLLLSVAYLGGPCACPPLWNENFFRRFFE